MIAIKTLFWRAKRVCGASYLVKVIVMHYCGRRLARIFMVGVGKVREGKGLKSMTEDDPE
jgi:hypothetical protein